MTNEFGRHNVSNQRFFGGSWSVHITKPNKNKAANVNLNSDMQALWLSLSGASVLNNYFSNVTL